MKRGMFEKIFFAGLVSVSLGIGVTGNVAANQADSEGEIELIPHESPTDPKDPAAPSEPQEPIDPNNPATDNKGPLSLDVVPKGFYFGAQKMYHTAHKYPAVGAVEHKQYLQVTDNRGEGSYGWTLKVRQDGYLRNKQSRYALKGATLFLPDGEARNRNNHEGATEIDPDLTTHNVEVTNEEKIIFSAPDDASKKAGKSVSTNSWQSQGVSLTIPKGIAREGEYSNKIYWILTDGGPTN